jgi:hypothetical protein
MAGRMSTAWALTADTGAPATRRQPPELDNKNGPAPAKGGGPRRLWWARSDSTTGLTQRVGFMAARAQDIHVQLILAWSGPGQGQIGVRVGRLLVCRANRQALGSWMPGARQERWPMRHLGLICCCRQWARPPRPTRAGRGQTLSGLCPLAVPEDRRTVVRAFSAVGRASGASRGYLQQLTGIWSRKGKG